MKYLFIGAHVDDVELSCGATISRLKAEGHFVAIMCMSRIYEGVDLIGEWKESMRILKPDVSICKDFTTRRFNEERQEILDLLFGYTGYDFIFCPSPLDFHMDHRTLAKECLRAFKLNNLITYIGTWNQKEFVKNYFFKVTAKDLDLKICSLQKYESQQSRKYMNKDYIFAEATVNGIMCNSKYAEAFHLMNYVI